MQFVYYPALSQTDRQMLMYEIEGNVYVRKSYDKKGDLIASQILKAGNVKKGNEYYTMPLRVYVYDKDGILEDSLDTYYRCKPSDRVILMNIFPFVETNSQKTIEATVIEGDNSYPTNLEPGMGIPDVSFSLSIKGGLAGFLGNNNKIKIYNRKVTSQDKLRNTYTVNYQVQLIIYLFSIKMKTINYSAEEVIDPMIGIISEYYKETNGSYFTLKLQ